MERISIFNYEAFYLDYLEGNLSEADTHQLLLFLEEHSECRLEEEGFMTLNAETPMRYSGKNNLKQFDETAVIGLDNVEDFMIADSEGLLNDKKQAELALVVAENEALKATRDRYKAVYFKPDVSVAYQGKADLKQRKTIVLWPFLSGVAAVAAIVVFVFLSGWNSGTNESLDVTADGFTSDTTDVDVKVTQKGVDTLQIQKANPNIQPVVPQIASSRTLKNKSKTAPLKKLPVLKADNGIRVRMLENLELQPIHTSSGVVANNILETSPTVTGPIPSMSPKNEAMAMNNPIAPVTKFISEKAKTNVDFGQRKASKDKKGGFFVKVGNFELSRNKN